MRRHQLALVTMLIVLISACSSSNSSAPPTVPPLSSPTASTAAVDSASAGAQTIEVHLTDALKMEPAQITVNVARPVRFVVINTGAIPHEFYLGDQAAQDVHEKEMMAGAMAMDEADGIVLKPGETRELAHTFATAGVLLAGCHEPGHYAGGMKAAITVVP